MVNYYVAWKSVTCIFNYIQAKQKQKQKKTAQTYSITNKQAYRISK